MLTFEELSEKLKQKQYEEVIASLNSANEETKKNICCKKAGGESLLYIAVAYDDPNNLDVIKILAKYYYDAENTSERTGQRRDATRPQEQPDSTDTKQEDYKSTNKKRTITFCNLVAYGNSEHVMQVLNAWHNAGDEHPHWQSLLHQTFASDEDNTPFREMIRKMPDVAEIALDWYTTSQNETVFKDKYVTFNFEVVEDFQDAKVRPPHSDESVVVTNPIALNVEGSHSVADTSTSTLKRKDKRKVTIWGPQKFTRTNHPLAIMVEHGRLNLLSHPLILCLLHQKWLKFGQYVYYLNLFTYCLFLIFLTTFALLLENPRSPSCINMTRVNKNETDDYCGITIARLSSIYGCAIVVLLMAIFRLTLEGIQLFKSMKWKYFTDWINYMEAVLYISTIMFVWVFHNDCLCATSWQWQLGVIAVFLGWIDLIIFVSHIPLIGIYVLMFVHIFFTFLKVLTLSILLIVAFGLTFYIAFTQPEILQAPFSSPARSLLKIMSMTAGDFDFNSIFQLDPTGESDANEDVSFPPISYALWIVFIIIMPILFINMLIGLAVGDINEVKDEAKLKKLELQVNLVLLSEGLLSHKRRLLMNKELLEKGVQVTCAAYEEKTWFKKVQFKLWGGELYDTPEKLQKFIHPHKHGKEKATDDLIQQVKDLKESIEKLLEGTSQAEK